METRTKYLRNVFRNGHLKTAGDGRITLYLNSKGINGGLPQNQVHSDTELRPLKLDYVVI